MTGSDQMLVWNQRESLEQPSERSPVSALLTLGKAREATLYAMSPLVVLGLKSQGLHEYFQFTRGESETQERFLRSPRSHSQPMVGPEPQSQSSDSHKDPEDPKVTSVGKGGRGLHPTPNPLGVDSPTGDSL